MNQSTKLVAIMACVLAATPALADVAYETLQKGGAGGQDFDSECPAGDRRRRWRMIAGP